MTSVLRDRKSPEKSSEDRRSQPHLVKGAHIITERIEVGVPADVAFDQWTRYEKWQEVFKKESASTHGGSERSERSEGSQEGSQEEASGAQENGDGGGGDGGRDDGDGDVTVRAKIGPSSRSWSVEITEMDPPHRLGWRAKGGLQAKGVTSFHSLDDRLTKVMVEIEYRPSGLLETVGNFFRMQRRRVRRDLRLFKNYVELRPDRSEEESGDGQDRRTDQSGGRSRSSGSADSEEAR